MFNKLSGKPTVFIKPVGRDKQPHNVSDKTTVEDIQKIVNSYSEGTKFTAGIRFEGMPGHITLAFIGARKGDCANTEENILKIFKFLVDIVRNIDNFSYKFTRWEHIPGREFQKLAGVCFNDQGLRKLLEKLNKLGIVEIGPHKGKPNFLIGEDQWAYNRFFHFSFFSDYTGWKREVLLHVMTLIGNPFNLANQLLIAVIGYAESKGETRPWWDGVNSPHQQ